MSEDAHRELSARTARGGAALIGARLIRLLVQLAATVVLARLLTPEDFGLFAMTVAVIGLLAVFRDAGLTQITIQAPTLDERQRSTLFWVNVATGAALTALGVALAPAIAALFGEPRVTPLAVAAAGVYLLAGPGVQHLALLRRELRFVAVAGAEVAATSCGLAVGVLAAWRGAGYWSLVAGQLAAAATLTAVAWSICRWRPRCVLDLGSVRELLGRGADITVDSLMRNLAARADNILVGWQAGAAALGFYTRAFRLMVLPMQQLSGPVASVATAALARVQDRPETFRSQHARLVSATAHVTLPAVALLFGLADPLVELALGPGWEQVVSLFSVLAIAAAIEPIAAIAGIVLVARGETRRLRDWSVLTCTVRCAAFAAGLPWGALGVAWAYAISSVVLLTPTVRHAAAHAPVAAIDVLAAAWRPAIASLSLAIAARVVVEQYAAWALASRLGAGLAAAVVVAGIVLAAWPVLRRDVVGLLALARAAAAGRPAPPAR